MPQRRPGADAAQPDVLADVVILSDLHLGAGRDPRTGRWSRLEDFFYDRELEVFLLHQARRAERRGRPLRLVLNGDVLDFLLVTEVPDDAEARRRGITVGRHERKYGLRHSEPASVWKLERIIEGHPRVFDALASLVAGDHELVILPGNHDPELFFAAVQRRLQDELVRRARAMDPALEEEELRRRIQVRPWYWHEPGRLFVEHGHQYDESNVLTHLLCPLDPRRGAEREIDLPVGSLFVRYVHNGLKRANPYIRNFISLDQYLRFLGSQDLLKSLPQAWRNMRFLVRAVREAPLWTGESVQAVCRRHLAGRDAIGREEGQTVDLARLEELWPVQMARTKSRLVRKMIQPALRQVAVAAAVLLGTIYLWALVFNLIQAVPWIAEGPFAKAGWLALLAVLTFVVVAVVVRTLGRLLKSPADVTFTSLERYAEHVTRVLGVPYVSMGHTHLADRRTLDTGATYVNTGTWTPLRGPWDGIQPRSMMFTFARLDGDGLHLLRWDHASREEVGVPLFEEARARLLSRIMPPDDGGRAGTR